MTISFSRLLIPVLICLAVSSTIAQMTATPPDLTKPQVLLEIARSSNGLSGEVKTPWHLKVDYEIFTDDGEPLGKGVFEEWWAAKDKWKQSYAGDHFTGVTYRSPEGSASTGHVPWPKKLIADALVSPIRRDLPKDGKLKPPADLPGAEPALACINFPEKSSDDHPAEIATAYCFDSGTAILRVRQDNYVMAAYARTGLFQGRHVGIDTTIQVNRHVLAKLNTDTLTTVPAMTPDAFGPTQPLQFTEDRKTDNEGVVAPKLLVTKKPEWSVRLGARPVVGDVVTSILVGVDGRVSDVHVLESPNVASADAVVRAILLYRFKAAEFGGKPVPVEVNIVVPIK